MGRSGGHAISGLNITLVPTYGYDAFGNRTSISIDDVDAGTPARTRSQLSFDGQVILVSTEYDNHGRVERTSRPYFHGDPTHWTDFSYDALGRVTSETAPGETGSVVTTFAYTPLEVLTWPICSGSGQQKRTLRMRRRPMLSRKAEKSVFDKH